MPSTFLQLYVGLMYRNITSGSRAGIANGCVLYRKSLKFHGQIYWSSFAEKGPTPGAETWGVTDEPDVLDAGDVVDGGGGWLRLVTFG